MSFSIGLTFYYWSYYKNKEKLSCSSNNTELRDFGEYSPKSLYVAPKYSTFKEELSNYKYISIRDYDNFMVPKLNAYMDTKKVKSIKAVPFKIRHTTYIKKWEILKYDINEGDRIQYGHILALILYTDFGELSTNFSATFRPSHPFETLSSMKSRNSSYYWMSRRLRETVQIFGDIEPWEMQGHKHYYTGLSGEFYLSSFHLRLCSPTSTSEHVEVALNFAGSEGLIVTFQNSFEHLNHISSFYCGWISRYKEESEYLWMGGHWQLYVTTIRCIRTKRKYKKLCKVIGILELFTEPHDDGYEYIWDEIDSDTISLLKALIDPNQNNQFEIDDYIRNTFELFRFSKTTLYFYLYQLNIASRTLGDVISIFMEYIDGDQEIECIRYEVNIANLFKSSIFNVFPNVEYINIYSEWRKERFFLSPLALLERIKNENFNKITIIGGYSWMKNLWEKTSLWTRKVIPAYHDEKLDIYRNKGDMIVAPISKYNSFVYS